MIQLKCPNQQIPSGVQLFSLDISLDKSEGLILRVWLHNDLLTVPIMRLSVRLKWVHVEVFFSIDETSKL